VHLRWEVISLYFLKSYKLQVRYHKAKDLKSHAATRESRFWSTCPFEAKDLHSKVFSSLRVGNLSFLEMIFEILRNSHNVSHVGQKETFVPGRLLVSLI
jgi:hypothetical protein